MTELNKEEILKKWGDAGFLEGLQSNNLNINRDDFDELFKNTLAQQPNVPDPFQSIVFPMIRRVASATLAGGGTCKSKKQQQKEDRINKLRQLDGKEPNVILPDDDKYDGLVSVQPMSATSNQLFYVDYKYSTSQEILRDNRKKKLSELNKKTKIKYIK
jgi:hypothetical protein